MVKVIPLIKCLSRKPQYKDVYRKTIEIPQRVHILRVNCFLNVHNAHFKLASKISEWWGGGVPEKKNFCENCFICRLSAYTYPTHAGDAGIVRDVWNLNHLTFIVTGGNITCKVEKQTNLILFYCLELSATVYKMFLCITWFFDWNFDIFHLNVNKHLGFRCCRKWSLNRRSQC